MDISENGGIPKSSILIGFSIINHPFWGTTIFGNIHNIPTFVVSFVPQGFFFLQVFGSLSVPIESAKGKKMLQGFDGCPKPCCVHRSCFDLMLFLLLAGWCDDILDLQAMGLQM